MGDGGTTSTCCRICASDATSKIGEVELVDGYRWAVQDCRACGCRFTEHDQSVYDKLHRSGAVSYYIDYRDLAANARRLFDDGNLNGLRELLSTFAKYRFVIEHIETMHADSRLLEVGCSRGYLTSHFILSGKKILAVDSSADAIETAKAYFGPHFALAGSPLVAASAPYDLIYHVGTIGCVADPVAFTRHLLLLLKPGGRLLFNAPNLDHCRLPGQIWIDAAPPPDLTTLFPGGFWAQHFSDLAESSTEIEVVPPDEACVLWLRKVIGTRGRWHLLERVVRRAIRVTRTARFVPSWPAPFGQFVSMTRNIVDKAAKRENARSAAPGSQAETRARK